MEENQVSIRRFLNTDIDNKIKWINDKENNEYLHYDLPLEYQKTLDWYEKNKNNGKRFDAVIEYNGIPVGVIGLINIDKEKKKAEFYITLGEKEYKRKGIATIATKKIVRYGFEKLGVNKIWLCVDAENIGARKLYEKTGFLLEGTLKKDIFFKGKMIDRCMYGMIKGEK